MLIRPLLMCLLILSEGTLFGQGQPDTIEIRRGLGTVFVLKGKKLTPRQLLELTRINPAAHDEMKMAKSNFDAASVFGFAGGFLVGWPLGTAVGGGEPNWGLAAVGAGLIAVGIPFSSSYSKHAKRAVYLYNKQLAEARNRKPHANFLLTYHAAGIRISF